MSARKFSPGDVALVRNQFGVWNRAICAVRSGHRGFVWSYGVADDTSPMTADARPLVVIDPDSRRDIERLRDWYDVEVISQNSDPDPRDVTPAERANALQAALREFADPTPRIEEPRGLYAAVEDRFGSQWVRLGNGPKPWMHNGSPSNRAEVPWASLDVVRVLSEGVPS